MEDLLQPSNSDRTVGLDDDKHTKEVMCDLGLSLNRPKANVVIINTLNEFNSQMRQDGVLGLGDSSPNVPLGFENSYGHKNGNMFPNTLPIHRNSVQHNKDTNSDSEGATMEAEETNSSVEAEGDASDTWEVGKRLDLLTDYDGDAIQVLMEEKDEWTICKEEQAL